MFKDCVLTIEENAFFAMDFDLPLGVEELVFDNSGRTTFLAGSLNMQGSTIIVFKNDQQDKAFRPIFKRPVFNYNVVKIEVDNLDFYGFSSDIFDGVNQSCNISMTNSEIIRLRNEAAKLDTKIGYLNFDNVRIHDVKPRTDSKTFLRFSDVTEIRFVDLEWDFTRLFTVDDIVFKNSGSMILEECDFIGYSKDPIDGTVSSVSIIRYFRDPRITSFL